jgi:DNA-binding response OmpR family regulator
MGVVSVEYTFLLIGKKTDTQWSQVLRQALHSLGKLHTVSEKEAVQAITQRHYDVVIVDAGAIGDVASLVALLRSKQRRMRIVVATASPTWQRAREILQAGAVDYIRKSLNMKELRSKIQTVVKVPPPSWPPQEGSREVKA